MAKAKLDSNLESMVDDKQSILPSDVALLYVPREGLSAKFVCSEFGTVELSTVTLEFAKQLEEKGYLNKTSGLV